LVILTTSQIVVPISAESLTLDPNSILLLSTKGPEGGGTTLFEVSKTNYTFPKNFKLTKL